MKKNEMNFTDVTEHFFGTKNEPTKKPPVKKGSAVENEAVTTPAIPEGFEPINPPAPASKPETVIPKEITDRLKNLDKLFLDATRNYVKIGYELYGFQQSKDYKALGFKTFDEFMKSQYSLSRSAGYNFIKVCVKYSVKDEDKKPTNILAKEYTKYSASQLVAMLSLDESEIVNIDPDKSVREIKKLTKSDSNYDSEFTADDVAPDGNDCETPTESGKPKVSSRDTNIPVFRLNFGTGSTWESVVNDKNRKLMESYLDDDKRKADGKDYRIELNIVYLDLPEA